MVFPSSVRFVRVLTLCRSTEPDYLAAALAALGHRPDAPVVLAWGLRRIASCAIRHGELRDPARRVA
ncbi:MAG: hypothetical protein ACRDRH_13415 [Pseudonocardia sp.]